MMTAVEARISPDRLDVAKAIAAVSDPSCGGVAVFVGTVRRTASAPQAGGREVVALEYDAHPTLADQNLRAIADEAARRWDLRRVVCVHRSGLCELGEPTVVVACASPHRTDALEACRWIIDTVKAEVPIWKREIFEDGSSWVGDERASHPIAQ